MYSGGIGVPNEISYSKIIYVKNLNIHQKKINAGRGLNPFQHRLNLSKTSKRLIIVTVDKDECMRLVPNTSTFPFSIINISVNKKKLLLKYQEK